MPHTGELVDALDLMTQLREVDAQIATADEAIDDLKEQLKEARASREQLVSDLRRLARGERALPFDGSKVDTAGMTPTAPPAPPPRPDPPSEA